jgi:integrase/recombinase XerD
MTRPQSPLSFTSLVQNFFYQRLSQQQNVSPHTIAAYRDTFRLLLRFLRKRKRKDPSQLDLKDLDAPIVLAFLNDLEQHRGNTVRTRNARLAALHSFMKYAGSCDPSVLPIVKRVLAIPIKRFNRPLLNYLTREEITAIVESPDPNTWSGRRDRALLTLLYNTGIRVSEAIGITRGDAQLDRRHSVQVFGKGRKERQIPLWKTTVVQLANWLKEIDSDPKTPLFPNRFGKPLSRSGVEDRLEQAVLAAVKCCPSLRDRDVSPHTLRHTTAMHLLQAGVDITLIALWLGHENPKTTHHYIEADLEMKQRVLENLKGLPADKSRYRPKAELLQFLDGL